MFDSAARSCLGPSTAAGMAHTGLAAEGRAGDGTAAGRSHCMREMTPYVFLQTKGKFCRHFHRVRDTESRVQTADGTDDSCSQLPRAPGPRVRDVPSRGGSWTPPAPSLVSGLLAPWCEARRMWRTFCAVCVARCPLPRCPVALGYLITPVIVTVLEGSWPRGNGGCYKPLCDPGWRERGRRASWVPLTVWGFPQEMQVA